jgi:hypothetical protein
MAKDRRGFQRYINYQEGATRGDGPAYTANGYLVRRAKIRGEKMTYYQLRKVAKLIQSLG